MSTAPFVTQQLDGTEFRLAEPADLSFIQQYGRVFRVFDDNDSGNISFGVDDGSRRVFIRLAGARTVNAGSSPEEAVVLLRQAATVYHDISHPNIVRCLGAIDHPPYFGLMFEWAEGHLLRRIDTASFACFRSLPVQERLAVMETLIDLMDHIHAAGYVAVDIYDASFLYDLDRRYLTLCDIDVFEKKPLVNTMGRMWGSTRFMSPEEFRLGAVIDGITNVYTLGAVSFLLFGDERTRTLAEWDAGAALFAVAQRATRDDRSDRYPGIVVFAAAWRQAQAANI